MRRFQKVPAVRLSWPHVIVRTGADQPPCTSSRFQRRSAPQPALPVAHENVANDRGGLHFCGKHFCDAEACRHEAGASLEQWSRVCHSDTCGRPAMSYPACTLMSSVFLVNVVRSHLAWWDAAAVDPNDQCLPEGFVAQFTSNMSSLVKFVDYDDAIKSKFVSEIRSVPDVLKLVGEARNVPSEVDERGPHTTFYVIVLQVLMASTLVCRNSDAFAEVQDALARPLAEKLRNAAKIMSVSHDGLLFNHFVQRIVCVYPSCSTVLVQLIAFDYPFPNSFLRTAVVHWLQSAAAWRKTPELITICLCCLRSLNGGRAVKGDAIACSRLFEMLYNPRRTPTDAQHLLLRDIQFFAQHASRVDPWFVRCMLQMLFVMFSREFGWPAPVIFDGDVAFHVFDEAYRFLDRRDILQKPLFLPEGASHCFPFHVLMLMSARSLTLIFADLESTNDLRRIRQQLSVGIDVMERLAGSCEPYCRPLHNFCFSPTIDWWDDLCRRFDAAATNAVHNAQDVQSTRVLITRFADACFMTTCRAKVICVLLRGVNRTWTSVDVQRSAANVVATELIRLISCWKSELRHRNEHRKLFFAPLSVVVQATWSPVHLIHITLCLALRLADINLLSSGQSSSSAEGNSWQLFLSALGHLLKFAAMQFEDVTPQHAVSMDDILLAALSVPHAFHIDVHQRLCSICSSSHGKPEDVMWRLVLCHMDALVCILRKCVQRNAPGKNVGDIDTLVLHALRSPSTEQPKPQLLKLRRICREFHDLNDVLFGVDGNEHAASPHMQECLQANIASVNALGLTAVLPDGAEATTCAHDTCLSLVRRGGQGRTIAALVSQLKPFLNVSMPQRVINSIAEAVLGQESSIEEEQANNVHRGVCALMTHMTGFPPWLLSSLGNSHHGDPAQQSFARSVVTGYESPKCTASSTAPSTVYRRSDFVSNYKTLGDGLLQAMLAQTDRQNESPLKECGVPWRIWDSNPVLFMKTWVRMLDSFTADLQIAVMAPSNTAHLPPIESPVVVELLSQLHAVLRCLTCAPVDGGERRSVNRTSRAKPSDVDVVIAVNAARWIYTLVSKFSSSEGDSTQRVAVCMEQATLTRVLAATTIVASVFVDAGNENRPSAAEARTLTARVLDVLVEDVHCSRRVRLCGELHYIASRIASTMTIVLPPQGLCAPETSDMLWEWMRAPVTTQFDGGTVSSVGRWVSELGHLCAVFPTTRTLTLIGHPLTTSLEGLVSEMDPKRVADAFQLLDGFKRHKMFVSTLSSMLVRRFFAAPPSSQLSAPIGELQVADTTPLVHLFRLLLCCSRTEQREGRDGTIPKPNATVSIGRCDDGSGMYQFAAALTHEEVHQCGTYTLAAGDARMMHSNASPTTRALHQLSIRLQLLEVLCEQRTRHRDAVIAPFASALCAEIFSQCSPSAADSTRPRRIPLGMTSVQAAQALCAASKLRLQWDDCDGKRVGPAFLCVSYFQQTDDDCTKVQFLQAVVQDGQWAARGDDHDPSSAAMLKDMLDYFCRKDCTVGADLVDSLVGGCLLPLVTRLADPSEPKDESLMSLRASATMLFECVVRVWLGCAAAVYWKRHVAVLMVQIAGYLYADRVQCTLGGSQDVQPSTSSVPPDVYRCVLASLCFAMQTSPSDTSMSGGGSGPQPHPMCVLLSVVDCERILFPWKSCSHDEEEGQRVSVSSVHDGARGGFRSSSAVPAAALRLDAVQCLQILAAWRSLDIPPSDAFFTQCAKRFEVSSRDAGVFLAVEMLEASLVFGFAPQAWMTDLVLRLHDTFRGSDVSVVHQGLVFSLDTWGKSKHPFTIAQRAVSVCNAYAEEHGVSVPRFVRRTSIPPLLGASRFA